ncbi:MAG: polysaccharide deacetylase family protein [Chitinivibrionales bacterium]|nr:polysaccharide deacetylase family protein [Chitinivibrionales bacterium]
MQIGFEFYPQARKRALALSYDDGVVQDKRLIELFNEYGLKGTFHLNSGLMGQGERLAAREIRKVYEGHEVSAHTATHPRLDKMPLSLIAREILDDRRALEDIVEYPVRGMSYPYGHCTAKIAEMLPGLGIEYARTVVSTRHFRPSEDFARWHPTVHHNQDLMQVARAFFEQPPPSQSLLYVWGHSYEFDRQNTWSQIEQFCAFAAGRTDVWYASTREIVDYLNALASLKFSVNRDVVYNPTGLTLWIGVDFKPVIVEPGATVRLTPLPA